MAIYTVGPTSDFPTIADAMISVGPGDDLVLESGYGNETAAIAFSGMSISGDATSTGITLTLDVGVATVALLGDAPINLYDAADGNSIAGNDGDNVIMVTGGSDDVSGGLGIDRLVVDYGLATGAVTGDSTSNFAEAGGGGRLVTINGGFEHISIRTGSGADTITTGDGDDRIRTGDGAGTVTAGQGANVIYGGADADTFTALDGGNVMDGGDGANTLTSGDGNDTLLSGIGADTIVAGGGDDQIRVRGGADNVDAGAGSDRLTVDYSAMTTAVMGGVTSGDLLSGHTGRVEDQAGASIDFVGAEDFTIFTGSGNDDITSGEGSDVLNGGAGEDALNGAGGSDTLIGGAGMDSLFGGAGDDSMNGGADSDIAFYADAGAGVTVNLAVTGAQNTGGAGVDRLVSIESVIGSDFDDVLSGGAGANTLFGGGGDDRLLGGGGDDFMIGGIGVDTLNYASAGSGISIDLSLQGMAQNTGGAGIDTILDFENVRGSAFGDNLTGTAGANLINGAEGDDMLSGGGAADRILGGAGRDTVFGGAEDDNISGDADNDTLLGDQGRDVINGGDGNDVMFGGDGNDVVNGGLGGDVLLGETGLDKLTGGAGADFFVFNSLADSTLAVAGRDQIMDFGVAGGDLIDLVGIDAIAGGADDAFTFTTAFHNVAGELRVTASASGTTFAVQGDVNGDSIADFAIFVTSDGALTAGDFLL
jgi:Ca2+-binding RTX toxin-like protein